MQKFGKFATAVLAATVLAFTGVVSFAAGQFEGTWKVTDTAGKAFEIKLGSDGSAKADRGEGMTGTWKEESGAAVITWDTGWTTKISKDGDKYTKAAFKKGEAGGKPANTSAAEKVQ
jgi:hypothetical protein